MKSIAKWIVAALLAAGLFPMALTASAAPSVLSISPSSGSKFGGTSLQIAGSDFVVSSVDQVEAVELSVSGTVSSLSFGVASSTRVNAAIPPLPGSYTGSAQIIVTFISSAAQAPVVLAYTFNNAFATESSLVSAPAVGSFSATIRGYSFSNNIQSVFISTSQAVVPGSFQPINDFSITMSIPVLAAASRSSVAYLGVNFTDGSPASLLPITLTGPTVTVVSPESGPAAGGTAITISGQGFMDGSNNPAVTKIMVGSDLIASPNFTVISDTTISATISPRSGNNKTVGANRVAVFYSNDVSSSAPVFYYFFPQRDAAKDVASLVMLGELASRTNRKPVFRTSATPFIVTGTDSLTKQPYEYETNYSYPSSTPAYVREGYQPGYTKVLSNGNLITRGNPSLGNSTIALSPAGTVETGVANPRDALKLVSNGLCGDSGNSFDAGDGYGVVESFCTVFGPEIYSETFYGRQGQSLGFNWRAIGNTDDYSVYGYLVAVENEQNIPSTNIASHTLVAHGVGSRASGSVASQWTSAIAEIPADGLYRFRFTNGSYDGTGGKAIGSTFLISSVYEAGLTNRITFGPIGDKIGSQSFTVNATALSGGEVSITSRDTNICSVSTSYSRPTTSVTITTLRNGTCVLVARRGLDGEYAPAADKLIAFDIRSAAIAPTAPIITQVNSGNQSLTVIFTSPSRDGGTPITSYEYSTDGGATWASASPTSTATSFTITSLSSNVNTALTNGVTYSLQVRAVSNVYPGLSSNTALGVPNAPALPNLSYASASVIRTLGVVTTILAPTNTGGSVVTYSYSGQLPPGLSLNSSTGIISGNPSQLGSSTIQLTGTNSTGTSSAVMLTITIQSAASNPPAISWPVGATSSYTAYVGTAFASEAPTNSNVVDAAVFSIQAGLPAGLSIDTNTGIVSGTATVTSSQTTYTITATNGAGTSTISFVLTVLPAVGGAGGSGGSGGSAPTYNGPEITSIVPNLVLTSGGETVVVVGRRLGSGMDVTIGGVTVAIRNASATGFTFTMPALSAAVYDMVYRYDGGARLTYLNAITVVASNAGSGGTTNSTESAPVMPKPQPKPWSAIGVASMFNPGSAVITPRVRAQVVAMLQKYSSRATRIECTGFTMGPNVLARDAKLSRDRATAVCNLIKQLRPRLTVVRAIGKQETRLGGEIRRVEVRFTR